METPRYITIKANALWENPIWSNALWENPWADAINGSLSSNNSDSFQNEISQAAFTPLLLKS
jgi:hypothetical protein